MPSLEMSGENYTSWTLFNSYSSIPGKQHVTKSISLFFFLLLSGIEQILFLLLLIVLMMPFQT